jgi:hypothetical protein
MVRMRARSAAPTPPRRHPPSASLLLLLALAAGLSATLGCLDRETSQRTLLDDLHTLCFSGCVNCEELVVDVLLYLDTVNLPTNNVNIQKLILSSVSTTPGANGNDMLEYFFRGPERLPPAIDPGILGKRGWKAKVVSARLRYCRACYTNGGLARVISAAGPLANVEFIYDPWDTLDIYVRTRAVP